MPRFKIHHITKYTYQVPVRDSANQIMLYPVKDQYQDVSRQELSITGTPPVDTYIDYYGNEVGSFMHAEPHAELKIESKIEVFTHSRMPPQDSHPREDQWTQLMSLKNKVPYIDFLKQERFAALAEVSQVAREIDSRSLTPLQAAVQLTSYVYQNFKYIQGVTNVESTVDEVWQIKSGVCQDFAQVLLVMLRMIDIPARYVSGYVCPNRNGMRGEGATHAWVEAYIPYYGWLGLDPTNNVAANDLHVRLAVGRSFNDCSPVKGTYKGTSNHNLEVGVSVSYEDGHHLEDKATILRPHPVLLADDTSNSYRRYVEMMQQQQQQQIQQ
ncbi:MAG: transglutaminase family protein [Chitinophagaceae bacterium]|nr:MAG: transglutaminase family protein [Chitinophagaceae bacterium]